MVYIPITRAQSDLYTSTYTKIFKLTKKIDESKNTNLPGYKEFLWKINTRTCVKKKTNRGNGSE